MFKKALIALAALAFVSTATAQKISQLPVYPGPVTGQESIPMSFLPLSTTQSFQITPQQLLAYIQGALAIGNVQTDCHAVPDNGVTDNTTAIANCIATYPNGIFFPGGVFGSNSNIAGFQTIRKYGPGYIKRAGALFAITPLASDTNTLYVATTGSDLNDGLDSGNPMLTIQHSFDSLTWYTDNSLLGGTWKIRLAAGTYCNGGQLKVKSQNLVGVYGPAGTRPFTPTAIVDGGGPGDGCTAPTTTFGFYTIAGSLYLQDLLIQKWSTSGWFGAVVEQFADLYTANVWFINDDVSLKAQQSRFFMDGGDVSGGTTGATMISGTTFTFGYQDSSAGTGHGANVGPYFHGQSQTAILMQENSTGHTNYVTCDTNPICFDIVDKSRTDSVSSSLTHNATTDIRCRVNSSWNNNPSGPNTLAGTPPYTLLYSGCYELNRDGQFNTLWGQQPLTSGFSNNPLTGSTSLTTMATLTNVVDAAQLTQQGHRFGVRINGNMSGTAGAKTISVQLEGASGSSPSPTNICSLTTNAIWVGDFIAECETIAASATAQANSARLSLDNSGTPAQRIGTSGTSITVGTQQLTALINAQLANSGDTITIRSVEPYEF